MLKDSPVIATVAVSDMEQAKSFYSGSLGLGEPEALPEGTLVFSAGDGTKFAVYNSKDNAGKSPATVMSFKVADAVAMRDALREKGVKFEEYDSDSLKTTDGLAEFEGFKAGWFKDPDGNILAINQDPAA